MLKKSKLFFTLTGITTAAIIILSGCGKTETKTDIVQSKLENTEAKTATEETAESKQIIFNLQKIPGTIDPALSTDESAGRVQEACLESLVRLGKKSGEIVPGVAKTWKISDDGKEWTFNLRKDAKWSNGEPVTAHDFVFSFKRALEPITAAQYSYLLYYLKNAEAYNKGKIKDFNQVGVKATNDFTLKIALCKPCPFFLQLVTNLIYAPLNEKFYRSTNGKFALSVNKMLYNGPWILTEWVKGGKFIFKKNPYFWDKDKLPKVSKLTFLLVTDYNTATNMFRNNTLDVTQIYGSQLPLFKNSKELKSIASGVAYLQLNTTNKLFKNLKIRKAMSMAIDREALANYIMKNGSIPAYAFVPPGTAGNKGKTFREKFGNKFLEYNVDQAKKLFAEGLKEINYSGTVKFSLLLDQTEDRRRAAQFIQEELHKNLGIEITLEPNTFQSRLQKTRDKDYEVVFGGWSPDYNDPLTYVELWYSTGGNNHSSWGNKEFDKYIDLASSSNDNEERMQAMAQAEQIVLKELPIIPLYYSTANWLIKDNLKDVILRPVGPEFTYAYWK